METLTAYPISITKQGEWKYFQVRLPKDATKIIGIETGFIVKDEIPKDVPEGISERFGVQRNRLMGELKLQSLDTANIFFAKDIIEQDRNMDSDAIRITEPPNPRRIITPPPVIWEPSFPWKHGNKMEEDGLLMLHNPVIAGIYKDAIGKHYGYAIHYKVMLYIWHSP